MQAKMTPQGIQPAIATLKAACLRACNKEKSIVSLNHVHNRTDYPRSKSQCIILPSNRLLLHSAGCRPVSANTVSHLTCRPVRPLHIQDTTIEEPQSKKHGQPCMHKGARDTQWRHLQRSFTW